MSVIQVLDTNSKNVEAKKNNIVLRHLSEFSGMCCSDVIVSDTATHLILVVFVLHKHNFCLEY